MRMTRWVIGCVWMFLVIGCGPNSAPLPPKMDEATQKKVNQSWNQAFTPPDQLNRQELLDLMLGTDAYYSYVDRIHLTSEKQLDNGKVVFEIHFDRSKPDKDGFHIKVYDVKDKVVREASYNRQEVETTKNELFESIPSSRPNEDPLLAQKRVGQESRWKRIQEFFPKDESENKK